MNLYEGLQLSEFTKKLWFNHGYATATPAAVEFLGNLKKFNNDNDEIINKGIIQPLVDYMDSFHNKIKIKLTNFQEAVVKKLNERILQWWAKRSDNMYPDADDVSNATYQISTRGNVGKTYHISTNQIISIKNLV